MEAKTVNNVNILKSATSSSLMGKFCAFSNTVSQIVPVVDLDIIA